MCSPGLEVEVEFAAPLALRGSVGDDDLDRTWSTGRAQEGVPLGTRTWGGAAADAIQRYGLYAGAAVVVAVIVGWLGVRYARGRVEKRL